jgi:uncharacterized membrane protein YkvA (DUF1232 family)
MAGTMTLESRCLDAFPGWLKTLGSDAKSLASVIEDSSLPETARLRIAGALTYLFKSLDLIPDGLEDLGFVDDAFVFRVAAGTLDGGAVSADSSGALGRLAADAALIQEFLGDAYPRLVRYVEGLESVTARGRSASDVVGNADRRGEFLSEVRQWSEGYEAPSFTRDEKNLVKLRSFLARKLPA